jgi:hypothetical protein
VHCFTNHFDFAKHQAMNEIPETNSKFLHANATSSFQKPIRFSNFQNQIPSQFKHHVVRATACACDMHVVHWITILSWNRFQHERTTKPLACSRECGHVSVGRYVAGRMICLKHPKNSNDWQLGNDSKKHTAPIKDMPHETHITTKELKQPDEQSRVLALLVWTICFFRQTDSTACSAQPARSNIMASPRRATLLTSTRVPLYV